MLGKVLTPQNTGFFCVKDSYSRKNKSKSLTTAMGGVEAVSLHTNEADQVNSGAMEYEHVGVIKGYTYVTIEEEESDGKTYKTGAWYTCPIVQLDSKGDFNTPDGEKTPQYKLFMVTNSSTKEVTFEDIAKKFPWAEKAMVATKQNSILLDDMWVGQVGPIHLSNDIATSFEAVDDQDGYGFIRDIIVLVAPDGSVMKNRNTGLVEAVKKAVAKLDWNKKQAQEFIASFASKTEYGNRKSIALEFTAAPDGGGYGGAHFGSDETKGTSSVAYMSSLKGGPLAYGDNCSKHVDKNSLSHPGHITTGAYFYNDEEFDGPLKFERNYWPQCGDADNLRNVHLVYDKGTNSWRWYTTESDKLAQPTTEVRRRTPITEVPPGTPPTYTGSNSPILGGLRVDGHDNGFGGGGLKGGAVNNASDEGYTIDDLSQGLIDGAKINIANPANGNGAGAGGMSAAELKIAAASIKTATAPGTTILDDWSWKTQDDVPGAPASAWPPTWSQPRIPTPPTISSANENEERRKRANAGTYNGPSSEAGIPLHPQAEAEKERQSLAAQEARERAELNAKLYGPNGGYQPNATPKQWAEAQAAEAAFKKRWAEIWANFKQKDLSGLPKTIMPGSAAWNALKRKQAQARKKKGAKTIQADNRGVTDPSSKNAVTTQQGSKEKEAVGGFWDPRNPWNDRDRGDNGRGGGSNFYGLYLGNSNSTNTNGPTTPGGAISTSKSKWRPGMPGNKGGANHKTERNQLAAPSFDGAVTTSKAGDPFSIVTNNFSNQDFRPKAYFYKNAKNGDYNDNIGNNFSASDWYHENVGKQPDVRSFTLTGYALEDSLGNVYISPLKGAQFSVPQTEGGAYFAPSDCSNQNPEGSLGSNGPKSNLMLNHERSALVFGFPRDTEKAKLSITESGGNSYLEIDVSNIGGIIMKGLPVSDPGISGAIWNASGTVAITL